PGRPGSRPAGRPPGPPGSAAVRTRRGAPRCPRDRAAPPSGAGGPGKGCSYLQPVIRTVSRTTGARGRPRGRLPAPLHLRSAHGTLTTPVTLSSFSLRSASGADDGRPGGGTRGAWVRRWIRKAVVLAVTCAWLVPATVVRAASDPPPLPLEL